MNSPGTYPVPASTTADLLAGAAGVLETNDCGGYTKPSPRLYPHQWNWDSAFIAIGRAHLDWSRAAREIETLLLGQWTDGMLPHIRYDPAVTDYAPGPEWWPDVPVRRAGEVTSGLSQPPVVPTAAHRIGLQQPDLRVRLAWWDRLYEPLADALRYFPEHRTVRGSPLIVVVHPWESGLDNSPRWDFVTGRGFRPSRPYRRVDTMHVTADARPTERDYDLYMFLVELIAGRRYDLARYFDETPFAVYDALFNAVWHRAALDLNAIADALDRPPAVEVDALRAFRAAYQAMLWDRESGLFRDFDVKAGAPIAVDTVAGLSAVYGGIVDAETASSMMAAYRARARGCTPLPSVPPDEPTFEPARYWRGPAWVNTNWMLIQGLRDLGLHDESRRLADETIALVGREGWHEFFHATTGEGLGGDQFSWSAALVIDLLRTGAASAQRGR